MALCSLRLRRVLALSSSLLHHLKPFSTIPAISASSPTLTSQNPRIDPSFPRLLAPPFHFRPFTSTTASLARYQESSEIGPDTILFEGCDYKHWLIVMEFPKDPKPTPEEMVETYVQTCAKVVGSVEEAKRKMYACSTTTYVGFQVEMTEEMSEKFRGLPGVVFILPDSYIDPLNKEYGGDKYINGTIIPRPPPPQYQRERRPVERNREFQQPRGPAPNRQWNSAYDNQGKVHGDARNYGAQQNITPQENPGPAGLGERRGPMPLNNAPVGRDTYQGDRRDPRPSYQANYNQGGQDNYYPQGQRGFPQRDYVPNEQRDIRGDYRSYAPPQGGTIGQGASGTHATGPNVHGPGGDYRQEVNAGSAQNYPLQGDQSYSQLEQRNSMQGEQRNYAGMGHTGTDQGRY